MALGSARLESTQLNPMGPPDLHVDGFRLDRPTLADVPAIDAIYSDARVAVKSGLTLQHRGPDAGNPDPDAVRLVYADRELTRAELEAALA